MYLLDRYGARKSLSSCCELIGHRRATDEVVAAAQPHCWRHRL